jgi:hypothetical protein
MKQSLTIWDILNKLKIWILSLSFIAILSKIFKIYKSIRTFLRIANYIILTMFGISILEAFGLGFIAKFLMEMKYMMGAVIAYVTESTFYSYLMRLFNVHEEEQSLRRTYKKVKDTDWKAEYEKAQQQIERDKWFEKFANSKNVDEGIDRKTIILSVLLFATTLGIWYYGKDALDVISPVWNISEFIKKILKGGRDDDDNAPTTFSGVDVDPKVRSKIFNKDGVETPHHDIELDDDVRSISPDMVKYATETVEKKTGNPYLDAIRESKALKKVKNNKFKVIDSEDSSSNIVNAEASSSNIISNTIEPKKSMARTITEALSEKFNELNTIIEEESDIQNEKWEDNSTTPTNSKTPTQDYEDKVNEIQRKGLINTKSINSHYENAKELEREQKSSKFIKAITRDEEVVKSSGVEYVKVDPNSSVSKVLDKIKESFPNIKNETIEKLRTPEGFKNRKEIIDSISESELTPEKNIKDIKEKAVASVVVKDMKSEDQDNNPFVKDKRVVGEVISKTLDKDSETVVQELAKLGINLQDKTYSASFAKAVQEEINSGKTEIDREIIRQSFLKTDLKELSETIGTSNIRTIRNVIRENPTHYNLMEGIRNVIRLDYDQENNEDHKIIVHYFY